MSKWKGAGNSHTEYAALAPDVPLKFKRLDCEKCAKETIFRGLKCLSCGTIKPLPIKRRLQHPAVGPLPGAKARDYRKQMYLDRIKWAQAKAAASREKFEGKK